MMLSEVAKFFRLPPPNLDIEFKNISVHSKTSLEKSLFLALKGGKSDGHQYISDAFSNGCVGAILEHESIVEKKNPLLIFPQLQNHINDLSGLVYPGHQTVSNIIGVTGTNGKTTITTLIKYLLEESGHGCGLMGTISCWDGKNWEEASHTTPPTTDIFRTLHQCSENKLKYCTMEVSSHALKQNRLGEIKLKAGVFTNLTQDHLDYHQTMDDYKKSKLKMLELINDNGVVVTIGDNEFGKEIAQVRKGKIIVVGKNDTADFQIKNIKLSLKGSAFTLMVKGKKYEVFIPLIGEHNIYNCVQALAVVNFLGFNLDQLLNDLKNFDGVKGRLEKVKTINLGPAVFVDYAHTPDAMDNVLSSVNGLKGKGKLWVVFGCGGDRDRTKRPLMAKSAEKFGDKIVVTSDNPRSEIPENIIKEIEVGFTKSSSYTIIVDRSQAIDFAVQNAANEDMVLLLGKGHEDYQIIGKEKHHFDDKEEAEKALLKRFSKK